MTNTQGWGSPRRSNYFVFMTDRSLKSKLIVRFNQAWERRAMGAQKKGMEPDIPVLKFACSNCTIDESHLLRGEATDLGNFLFSKKPATEADPHFSNSPPAEGSLILLSGTPWEKGPADIRLYLAWFNEKWTWQTQRCTEKIPYLSKEDVKVRQRYEIAKINELRSLIKTEFKYRFSAIHGKQLMNSRRQSNANGIALHNPKL
jgi:hypothetical protein